MEFLRETTSINASEYKKFHESFMQNNHGSSAPHVFFCIFFTVQCSVYASLKLQKCNSYQYLYEYMIIVFPLILAHTILAAYIYLLNFAIMALLLMEFYQKYPRDKNQLKYSIRSKKIYSISIMRGLTYIITIFAILGVDFVDFPRHLSKTEKYGYSLMDTGVGLFVLMSGLVHKNLRQHSFINIVKGNSKFIFVLVMLGVVRYLSVKQLDYQEHVTEYGVHWNFFFTLAVCKLFSTAVLYFNINALVYSFILLFTHELILYGGVQDWVFSDVERDSFISANREGISSCLGYVSLYLFAAYIKNVLSTAAPFKLTLLNYISIDANLVQILLTFATLILWIVVYTLNSLRPISRTLANASYCIYIEAILVTIVTVLYYVENILQYNKYSLKEPKIIESVNNNGLSEPKIIESVNNNGLSYFLLANLMTGAINLSIKTLLVSSTSTFVILHLYMITSLFLTVSLGKIGIKI